MSPDQIAALGAFLSGAGSVVGGFWVVRSVRKRDERRCHEMIEQLRAEYDRGVDRGLHLAERDDDATAS